MDSKNTKYLIFTVILLILSVIGVFVMFQINSSPLSLFLGTNTNTVSTITTPTSTPTIKITPTLVASASASANISTSSAAKVTITLTPTATPTAKVTITPTPTSIPTVTPTSIPTATPTPLASGLTTYKSTTDGFSIQHSTSRKVYQDTESTGSRYTFYSSLGNFAVHVAPSGTWAWTNPDRTFSYVFSLSGKSTYRYDIATQTIVDLQSDTKNYTIQCVHNGKTELKTECEAFINSFQLL